MQVLFGKVLMDEQDKEIKGADNKPFTLKAACFQSLGATFPDEQNLSGEDKFKRFELYQKIKSTPDPVDLTAEEVALLKKLVGKGYGSIIMGQCWMALENK